MFETTAQVATVHRVLTRRLMKQGAKREDAEDAVSHAIVGLLEAKPDHPWSWMTLAARNKLSDILHLCANTRTSQFTDDYPFDECYDLVEAEVLADQLPEREKAITRLRAEGYTFSEIADELGQTTPAVKSNYFRSVERNRRFA